MSNGENYTCKHQLTIGQLVERQNSHADDIREIKDAIKLIQTTLNLNYQLQADHAAHREGLSRAFKRIESLELFKGVVDDMISQMKGMQQLAKIQWIVMSGGLGVILLKLFNLL